MFWTRRQWARVQVFWGRRLGKSKPLCIPFVIRVGVLPNSAVKLLIMLHSGFWALGAGHLKSALLIICFLLCCDRGVGEDLTLKNGKVLRNVEVMALEKETMAIRHEEGTVTVPIVELPQAFRDRYTAEALFRQLKEKTLELEQLRRDLRLTRGQLRRKGSPLASQPQGLASATDASSEPKAAPLVAELPPLEASAVIDAFDLVDHYAVDPANSDRRYKGKVIHVRGAVEQFGERLFQRSYRVRLQSPDGQLNVTCQFSYPDDFKRVFSKNSDSVLAATRNSGQEVVLCRTGDTVIIKGTCRGITDQTVLLTGCEIVNK